MNYFDNEGHCVNTSCQSALLVIWIIQCENHLSPNKSHWFITPYLFLNVALRRLSVSVASPASCGPSRPGSPHVQSSHSAWWIFAYTRISGRAHSPVAATHSPALWQMSPQLHLSKGTDSFTAFCCSQFGLVAGVDPLCLQPVSPTCVRLNDTRHRSAVTFPSAASSYGAFQQGQHSLGDPLCLRSA